MSSRSAAVVNCEQSHSESVITKILSILSKTKVIIANTLRIRTLTPIVTYMKMGLG